MHCVPCSCGDHVAWESETLPRSTQKWLTATAEMYLDHEKTKDETQWKPHGSADHAQPVSAGERMFHDPAAH